MRLLEAIEMIKIKFNYFFFVWTVVLPLAIGTLGTIIYWPAIHSHYWEMLMSPMMNIIIGGYVVVFAFSWAIAAYLSFSCCAVIKEDIIVFHRLFRRKLEINLRDVKYAELHGKFEGRRRGNHISFIMKDGERKIAMGLNYEMTKAIIEHLKNIGIDVQPYTGGMTDEEWKAHVRRGY